MWLMLERGGRRELAPFGALIYEPANNIYAHPEDLIYLYREPQTFLSFGALGGQRQTPFDTWRLSLAEALSKIGGLSDAASNPAAVFLYRGETRAVAEAMGVVCAPFEGPIIPVIYIINMKDPAGYFIATTFEMRNKDVIYVSNSFSVEQTKFTSYLGNIISTAEDPIGFATQLYAVKNLIRGTGQVPSFISTTTTVTPPPPRRRRRGRKAVCKLVERVSGPPQNLDTNFRKVAGRVTRRPGPGVVRREAHIRPIEKRGPRRRPTPVVGRVRRARPGLVHAHAYSGAP
jgi:hypothetical protein